MKQLLKVSKIRKSALHESTKDDVLEIMNLLKDDIDPERFFTESFFTDGINILLKTAFGRFQGIEDKGLVKLTQSMGGGKTHSMITLGLLAKHPEFRDKFAKFTDYKESVRVVGFSGRQSDTELGIWGEIAKQLGKEEQFKQYFNPVFKAPGHEAWISLLKDQPTLILLDELAPYLVNAKSITVGNSDLSVVTATALSNLFNAVKEQELSKVLVVVSDLSGSWAEGNMIIQEVLKDARGELSRASLPITPVDSQNELVDILRAKLFENLPSDDTVKTIAQDYKNSHEEARKMGLTNSDSHILEAQIQKSYPFHPSFINLYHRFKENEGFQQTRGVIRLVRMMLRDMEERDFTGALIAPYDVNLDKPEIRTSIEQLNPTLVSAIKHDISDEGNSAAELKDKQNNSSAVTDIAKLLLVSSLSNVTGGLKGLSTTELVDFLVRPGLKVSDIKSNIDQLVESAWYLATDKDNKLFFQNQENLIARLNNLVDSYDDESAKKEIKAYLEDELKPLRGDGYQKVVIFPPIDELKISSSEVTLLVTEPSAIRTGLPEELRDFWKQHSFKNRFLFLSGERQTWDNLTKVFKEHKGIKTIIEQMTADRVSPNDPQFIKAGDKRDKIRLSICSVIRETFIKVSFPRELEGREKLADAEINFQFDGMQFNAEKQIIALLKEERKFTEDVSGSTFREMVEDKLFGPQQKEIRWSDLKDNAARSCRWTWHHPRALDDLKTRAISEGQWRDNGGYIQRGPFPQEATSVDIKLIEFDKESKTTFIKIIPKYGDKVYLDTNEHVSTASKLVENLDYYPLKDYRIFVLCVDSKQEHEVGAAISFTNPINISHRFYDEGNDQKLELQANCGATIKYTTDGSDPKDNGAIYDEPITIPEGANFLRTGGEVDGEFTETETLQIPAKTGQGLTIDDNKPLTYKYQLQTSDNNETYTLLEDLKSAHASVSLYSVNLNIGGPDSFITISFSEDLRFDADNLKLIIDQNRQATTDDVKDIEVTLKLRKIYFSEGLSFKHFIGARKMKLTNIGVNDVEQK